MADNNDARERVLDAAERLFAQRGYIAVTLRDIAKEVGIRHTSLYHHAPGGKEELFIEVTERNLQRHEEGLTQAMQAVAPDVRAQLHAAADWLLSQPPMDLIRFIHSDLAAIAPARAERLYERGYGAMIGPIEAVLEAAKQRGDIDHDDMGLIAGGIVGMVESLYGVPEGVAARSHQEMAHDLINIMVRGVERQ